MHVGGSEAGDFGPAQPSVEGQPGDHDIERSSALGCGVGFEAAGGGDDGGQIVGGHGRGLAAAALASGAADAGGGGGRGAEAAEGRAAGPGLGSHSKNSGL